ncbi:MAG: ATP-sensitive inward rectifier potassium channel 10, partial [Proteobacteria bacterium]|nr:ATP-sensitive inward rectifier potassium channel 10 [Pseudomonadota bacterium]
RIANERYNRIVEATATMSLVRTEIGDQGESFVRIHDLRLIREGTPVFALTWSLMHRIDEQSPLQGLDRDQLLGSRSGIVVSVTGHDETMAASVHAVKDYSAGDVIFDGRFADILSVTPEGDRRVDMTRFHDTEPASMSGVDTRSSIVAS